MSSVSGRPVELTASTIGPPVVHAMRADRARRDDDPLEQVDVGAQGVCHRGLDRVGVADADDRAARMLRPQPVERRHHPDLHLGEALAVREAERRRRPLHGPPLGQLHQLAQLRAGPVAEVAFEQPTIDLGVAARSALPIGAAVSLARSSGERVHGVDRLQFGDPLRRDARPVRTPSSARCRPLARPGSTLPVVGVWPWRTSRIVVGFGPAACRLRWRSAVLAASWTARRRASECLDVRGSSCVMAVAESTVDVRVSATRRARCRDHRVPCVPPSRRVARAGRASRSGRRSATRRTGAARSRVRRPGGADRRARVSPRPPTARTGPVGCSPATAAATGCSGRCTGPASPARPTSVSADDGLALNDAWVTAAVKCAPPANKPTPDRTRCRVRPFLRRELALLERRPGGRVPRDVRLRRGLPPLRRSAAPEVRPRRRGAMLSGRPDAAVLVTTQPAEHVHQAPDRGHARRRVRPRRRLRSGLRPSPRPAHPDPPPSTRSGRDARIVADRDPQQHDPPQFQAQDGRQIGQEPVSASPAA